MKIFKRKSKGTFNIFSLLFAFSRFSLHKGGILGDYVYQMGITDRYLNRIDKELIESEQVFTLKRAKIYKSSASSPTAESVFVCYPTSSDVFKIPAIEYALEMAVKNPGVSLSEACTREEYFRAITGQTFTEMKWLSQERNWELLTAFFDAIDLSANEIVETCRKFNFFTVVTRSLP